MLNEYGQIKAREEQDRIRTVANRAVVELEADQEQTKRVSRKRHDRAGEARTWDGKARAGYGRIMPKKDMTALDRYARPSRSSIETCHKFVSPRYDTLAQSYALRR